MKVDRLPSGNYHARITLGGTTVSITRPTAREVRAEAAKRKAAYLENQQALLSGNPRLRLAVQRYIDERRAVLSPSTLAAYDSYVAHHFQEVMDAPIRSINWQHVVNLEAKKIGPKTLKNVWGLISASIKMYGLTPTVRLPSVSRPDTAWLEPDQIPLFLAAIRGKSSEIAALLGLCSLRRSEIAGLRWRDYDPDGNTVHVHETRVKGADGLETRSKTKTYDSDRLVPVFIPRLAELLQEGCQCHKETERIVPIYPEAVYRSINRACEKAGLPLVGIHGLRRSFMSAAYSAGLNVLTAAQIGGWSDFKTIKDHYLKLSTRDRVEGLDKLAKFFEN